MTKAPMEIIPKEKVLKPAESWFSNTIKYIENIKGPEIDWDERLLLLLMYNRGIRDSIGLLHDDTYRITFYEKDPLSAYMLGVKESIYMIRDMMDNIDKISEEHDVNIEKIRALLADLYMKGMRDAGDLHIRHKLDEKMVKVIEDVDAISAAHEEEPEEAWEKIRNRLGVSLEF